MTRRTEAEEREYRNALIHNLKHFDYEFMPTRDLEIVRDVLRTLLGIEPVKPIQIKRSN